MPNLKMEINHRIQGKFSENNSSLWIEFPDGSRRDSNYNEVELILKDIRFIRHELSNYSYLYASQLSFHGHLDKNYWEFLCLKGENGQHERDELEGGVLLTLYLLYSEIFEEEGMSHLYRNNLHDTVIRFLGSYSADNENKRKLKNCIQFSIANYENEHLSTLSLTETNAKDKNLINQLNDNDKWVYRTFIEDYFIDIANSFEPIRKNTKNFFGSIQKNGNH